MPSGPKPKQVTVEVTVRNLRREVEIEPGARAGHVLARLGLPGDYLLARTRRGDPFPKNADIHRCVPKGSMIHAFPPTDVAGQPELNLLPQLGAEENR